MLHQTKTIAGFKLNSLDGEIGKVREFYFDDQHWSIRYLVADTGSWLSSRLVLISPHALAGVNEEDEHIRVELTKKQIEDSPSWNTDKPVSRQFEIDYHGYYGWPGYWMGNYPTMGPNPAFAIGAQHIPAGMPPAAPAQAQSHEEWDPHLRSTKNVTGHRIEAEDGEIGHVEDFLLDDESWKIRYLVLDTRNWWPGKKILVAPEWIEGLSWEDSKVFVNLTRNSIKEAPEYDSSRPLSRDYETQLHQHYNRHGYWANETAARER